MQFLKRHVRSLVGGGLLAALLLALPKVTHAGIFPGADTIGNWLANIAYWLVQFVANLLVVIINITVAVAQYNRFLDSPAVEKGWVIVRDLSNMFFIVVLLIIAFGTILRLENYRYNRLLARLIIMAILVNFSKFIAGFFIDFAQVITLTFVNAWRDAAAGNITDALGLTDIIQISGASGLPEKFTNVGPVLTAMLLGLFLVTVAAIVMAIIAIVLILRILALWFLIVLSPLAYLLRTYPSTERYAARWWQEFGKYVVVGPVVAFLLWLSLAIMSQPSSFSDQVFLKDTLGTPKQTETTGLAQDTPGDAEITAAITTIGRSDRLLSYITAIMLLVGTLVITKELGVAGGQLAGQAAERIRGFATKAATVGGATAAFGGLGLLATTRGKQVVQLAKGSAGFAGRKLDEWNIQGQQGKGLLKGLYHNRVIQRVAPGVSKFLKRKQFSLRPSMMKKAYEDYRRRQQENAYEGVLGGSVDIMNLIASRGKLRTRYGDLERRAAEGKKRSEVTAGGTKWELLFPQLKRYMNKDMSEPLKGQEGYVRAILKELFKNHDPNELFKDPEIRKFVSTLLPDGDPQSYAGRYNDENMTRLLEAWFGDEAGELGFELGEIAQANKDVHIIGISSLDSRTGESRLNSIERYTRDRFRSVPGREKTEFKDLRAYRPEDHGGMKWSKFKRTQTAEQQMEYRDAVRDDYEAWTTQLALLQANKMENRQAALRTPQQAVAQEIGHHDHRRVFDRALGPAQEVFIRDFISQLSDYRYAPRELKAQVENNLDTLLAWVDSEDENPELAEQGLKRYEKLTGGETPRTRLNKEQRGSVLKMTYQALGLGEVKEAEGFISSKGVQQATSALSQVVDAFYGGTRGLYLTGYNQRIIDASAAGRFDGLDDTAADALEEELSQQVLAQLDAEGYRIERDPDTGRYKKPAMAAPSGMKAVLEAIPKAGGAAAAPAPPPAPAGRALTDVDVDKYDRTREMAAQYEAETGAGSFFQSAEYRDNRDAYLSEQEYGLAEQLQAREAQEIGGMAYFGRKENPSNVLGFDARTFAGGKFAAAGEYLTDPEQKRQFAEEYVKLIDQEYAELEAKADKTAGDKIRMEHLKNARARLSNPAELASLQVINRGRLGYSDRHAVAHESTHAKLDELDPDRSFRNELFDGMNPEQRTSVVAAMRKKMGNAQMDEKEAFDEYLTEGLVNAWESWADVAPDAVKLDPAFLKKIQSHAVAQGKQPFMVSPDVPDLEKLQKSAPGFLSAFAARGYALRGVVGAQLSKSKDQLGRAFKPIAEGVGRVRKQFAEGYEEGVGQRAREAVSGKRAAVLRGIGAVAGKAQRLGRGAVAVTAVPFVAGAAAVRGAVETLRMSSVARKQKRLDQARVRAKSKMEIFAEKRLAAKKLRDQHQQFRKNAATIDVQRAAQIERLRTQRADLVRTGRVDEVQQVNQQMAGLEQQRQGMRTSMRDIEQQREAAEREESKARLAAQKEVDRAHGTIRAGATAGVFELKPDQLAKLHQAGLEEQGRGYVEAARQLAGAQGVVDQRAQQHIAATQHEAQLLKPEIDEKVLVDEIAKAQSGLATRQRTGVRPEGEPSDDALHGFLDRLRGQLDSLKAEKARTVRPTQGAIDAAATASDEALKRYREAEKKLGEAQKQFDVRQADLTRTQAEAERAQRRVGPAAAGVAGGAPTQTVETTERRKVIEEVQPDKTAETPVTRTVREEVEREEPKAGVERREVVEEVTREEQPPEAGAPKAVAEGQAMKGGLDLESLAQAIGQFQEMSTVQLKSTIDELSKRLDESLKVLGKSNEDLAEKLRGEGRGLGVGRGPEEGLFPKDRYDRDQLVEYLRKVDRTLKDIASRSDSPAVPTRPSKTPPGDVV